MSSSFAASAVASLPEVCGDAAVYVDPLSVESIAQGIRDVLDRPPPGGLARAARFTWEPCARGHGAVREVCERILAARGPR